MINETTPGNVINQPNVKAPDATSHFELNRRQLNSLRFGEVSPHLVFKYVPDDKKVTVHSATDFETFTLSNRLKSNIKMRKAYFSVPMQCYLPINWEKVYKNPDNGDDVIAENVNSVIDLNGLASNLFDAISNIDFSDLGTATIKDFFDLIRYCFLLEGILSSGSVFRSLGYSYNVLDSRSFSFNKGSVIRNVFDYNFEQILGHLKQRLDSNFDADTPFTFEFFDPITNDSLFTLKYITGLESFGSNVSFDDLIFHMREHNCWKLTSGTFDEALLVDDYFDVSLITECQSVFNDYLVHDLSEPFYYNLDRLIAYNIVCKHYLTNDKVDYIYSAELYRQYMKSLILAVNNNTIRTFSYNGVTTEYDVFSYGYLGDLVAGIVSKNACALFALTEFFAYKRSLRYVDYFTGSRPSPLAIGDTNVAVNSNLVNVVDVIQKIQRTRFFNAVARVGKRIEQYVEGIFHTKMAYDYHNPAWLATTVDEIYTQEIENTGADQLSEPNTITCVLGTDASDRYAFEMDFDRPGIIIGVTLFDIQRAYPFSNDRQNLEIDRFDMFNPFMQFVGDQAVYLNELNGTPYKTPFSYQLRNMDYKQSFDIAAGAFVDNLPGWAFLVPSDYYQNIDDEFIHSRQVELDKFYVRLSGHTLASRFHFIVIHNNKISANRPMVYQPQLL